MGKFTDEEKLAELDREVKMRKQVYSRYGDMTEERKRQLAIMQEIADEYREALKPQLKF